MKKIYNQSKLLCAVFLFFYVVISAQSVPAQKPSINAEKIDAPFELTGKLDNPNWKKAIPVDLDYEFRPGDNVPAPQKTKVRVLYDNENIYFGFECNDTEPNKIRANVSDRDKMFNDDFVIVIFDTYGDLQKSYEFAVNPFGNQGDLLATSGNEDSSMDYVWYSAASMNGNGWTAEMKIPFKSISFPKSEAHTWPIHFSRNIPRTSRHQTSWMKIDRNIPGFMTQAGVLTGLKNIQGGGLLELLPYVVGERGGQLSQMANPNSDFKFNPIKGRIGAGIKYSPSQNLSFEAVLNPDFSQIESDAEQITINTTFALNYQEKRPFFLTGSDMLQTPMYYSRSINNPLGAARVLGKNGKFSYLVLSAYDRNTVIEVPGEERSNTVATDLKSLATIAKLRYDFGDESYIGALGLGRNLDGGSNYLMGFDWNYKFLSNWNFGGEVFLSKTNELNDTKVLGSARKFGDTNYNAAFNGESYSGSGAHLILNYDSRSYEATTVINSFSPTYQTYNGLFGQVNYHQIFMQHEYNFYPENSFIDNWTIALQGNLQFNYQGIKKEQFIMPRAFFTLKGQTNVNLSYLVLNDEMFNGKYFTKINRAMIFVNSNPLKELSVGGGGQIGKFIFRSSNPEMGVGHNLSFGFTVKPSSQFKLTIDYSRARLSSEATNKLFYDGNIYRLVGVYQFNSEMFLRVITQYNTFDKSFNLYPLFSYKLNPFTTFYAGATSAYSDYNEFGMKNTAQQYFIKLQYLLGV